MKVWLIVDCTDKQCKRVGEMSSIASVESVDKNILLERRQIASTHKKIWVDLDNSPHVPFFRPIIEELRKRQYEVLVTARDAYQVRELLDFYGVSAKIVGKHHGKHKVLKALGTCSRAIALGRIAQKERPDLAINHGSRACLLACTFLGIQSVTLLDYEFTTKVPTIKPTWLMAPAVLPNDQLPMGSGVLKYPGIKEDVYLPGFRPDPSLKTRLGISPDDLLVTIRPPATEAHYHNPESEPLLAEALKRFVASVNTRILLLPRNKRQEAELRSGWGESIAAGKIVIPQHVEDGLNLIWNSDLVISGGGTMNREAAAMGVPVYSIFRGKIGAVDRYLADEGRLIMVETVDDVRTKVKAVRRERLKRSLDGTGSQALGTIISHIVSIVEQKARAHAAAHK